MPQLNDGYICNYANLKTKVHVKTSLRLYQPGLDFLPANFCVFHFTHLGGMGLNSKEYTRLNEIIGLDGSIASVLTSHQDLALQVSSYL